MIENIFKKQSGAVLLISLIFAFVVMVMLTGLLYSFKMGLITTRSIVENNNKKVLGKTYIENLKDDIDFTKDNKLEIDDNVFEMTIDGMTSFFPKNSNAELFEAQKYNSYTDTYKAYVKGQKPDLVENIIYNAISSNVYKNYGEATIPINVPMINVSMISDGAKRYRLNNSGELENNYEGFIGFIKTYPTQLFVFTETAQIGLGIPDKMGTDYKVKIGWNLEDGKWIMLLLLYDGDKIYTTSILLEDLLKDDVKGLANENTEVSRKFGDWTAVNSGDSKSGVSGTQFVSDNILDAVWYFEEEDAPPELLVVRKGGNDQSPHSSDGKATKKNRKYSKFKKKLSKPEVLEFYYSSYSSSDDQYKLKLGDDIRIKQELTTDNVKLRVPDFKNNLESSMVLVFHPNNESADMMAISDYNYNGNHKVGKILDTYIDGDSFGEPVIVSNLVDSVYIITYEDNVLHRCEHKRGYGNFVSLDYGVYGFDKEFDFTAKNDSFVAKHSDDEDETIQVVIPKFGYLFVFTQKKIIQLNYDFDVLQELPIGMFDQPQILADFDAVKNTINKIYIQNSGITVRYDQIADDLGYKELSESNTKNDQDEFEDEDATDLSKIYLDSKQLYPLGIVKEIMS